MKNKTKIISFFNNKGGVGKTTLGFHFAAALAEIGKKVLMVDLDPQCNLTLAAIKEELISKMWKEEDDLFRYDTRGYISKFGIEKYEELFKTPRTVHFLLKATQDGETDRIELTKPINVQNNLDLIPGRLTLHLYEQKISESWSGIYQGNPTSIRVFMSIRDKALKYAEELGYEYIIFDTSPSLGMLNKTIISTADAFIIPCNPDIFSLYGIKNIGNALQNWKKDMEIIKSTLPEEKKELLPEHPIQFIGYTIYNSRKYTKKTNNHWNLARAHYNHANSIPNVIKESIPEEIRKYIEIDNLKPFGEHDIMHSHNTFPAMAQKYSVPMWKIKDLYEAGKIEEEDENTLRASRAKFYETKEKYTRLVNEVLEVIKKLN